MTKNVECFFCANTQEEVDRLNEFFENVDVSQDLYWWVQKEPVARCAQRRDRQARYIERDGGIIGACLVWTESRILGPSEARLRTIVVSSSHRGEGHGYRLIQDAEDFAEALGKKTMVAEVTESSSYHDWWERQGYEERDRRVTSAGRGMVVYEKELKPDYTVEDPLTF